MNVWNCLIQRMIRALNVLPDAIAKQCLYNLMLFLSCDASSNLVQSLDNKELAASHLNPLSNTF